jgi:succinate dehydrogenase hydrophobic anchor subunit
MRLKKANATLGLLAILILLAHAGYQVVAYILFIYNPFVTKVLAWAAVAVVSLHAVLGMSMLMFVHDGSSARSYSGMNLRTILQRAAKAAGSIMKKTAEKSISWKTYTGKRAI